MILFIFSEATPKPPVEGEEEKFEPSVLNSTVYLISMTLQIATFAINYRVGITIT